MHVVTDRACDIHPDQLEGVEVHFTPMKLTLDDKTYSSGVDLSPEEFYDLLETTDSLPATSQATAGDFADLYRQLAKSDPDILSIHISSGLSGTLASAKMGAEMVPEANVTFWDSKTLSCPLAWQVEAAVKAVKCGWNLDKILLMLNQVREATEGLFTVEDLKYLVHGGRISHLKGLIASLLHIRPVIGVEKDSGRYYTLGQERTSKRTLNKMAETLLNFYPEGSNMRMQLLHGKNPDALNCLREAAEKFFQCSWIPTVSVGPILGAHTGGSLIGLCAAPAALFNFFPV